MRVSEQKPSPKRVKDVKKSSAEGRQAAKNASLKKEKKDSTDGRTRKKPAEEAKATAAEPEQPKPKISAKDNLKEKK